MMQLFKRQTFVEYEGKTFGDPLTIEFDVNFSEEPETDTGSVKIYNLSKNTLSQIKSGKNIRISAGYESTRGNIFNGQAIDITTTWSGVDKVTEFILGDSTSKYRNDKVTRSFAPGSTSDDILMYLITKAGLGIGDFSPVKTIQFPNGFTINERLQTAIKKMVAQTQSKYYIKGMLAYVRATNKGDVRGFTLNKDTGLLDIPEEFVKEIGEKEYKGYKVKMLLNHQISVDSIIIIQSKTANGTFRVSSGSHESSSDYITTAEVYPI